MYLKCLLLFLAYSTCIIAQSKSPYCLEVKGLEKLPKQLQRYQKNVADSSEAVNEVTKLQRLLSVKGYIFNHIDSSALDSLTATVFLVTGDYYRWAKVRIEGETIYSIQIPKKLQPDKAVNYLQLNQFTEKIIDEYENQGFPFVTVTTDSFTTQNNAVSVQLKVDKGPFIIIDTVRMIPAEVVKQSFLKGYLGLKRGSTYKESLLKQVDRRWRALSYVNVVRPTQVVFVGEKAKVYAFIEKRKANQFDGIIGLQSKNNKPGTNELTGDIKLQLVNSFKRGEFIGLKFKALPSATRDFGISTTYPYILGSPFGIDFKFELFKQDTQYVESTTEIGLQYLFIGANYIKVFLRNRQSNILSTSSLQVSILPTVADVATTLYGLAYNYNSANDAICPTQGFSTYTEIAAGIQKISKNPAVKEEAYASVSLTNQQFKIFSKSTYYYSITNRMIAVGRLEGGVLAANKLFANELFRIGGSNSLRGFDEQSILASVYGIGTAEYRILLEQGSYLYAFFDQGAYSNNVNTQVISDSPSGFGTGLSFRTKTGNFNISYAIGKQFKNPVSLQTGKIHFGIINTF